MSVAQAATREGFDILRHPLSLLSTGDLGWLQITNFVVAGVLALVGARGLRTAMRGTPGGVWAPRLVGRRRDRAPRGRRSWSWTRARTSPSGRPTTCRWSPGTPSATWSPARSASPRSSPRASSWPATSPATGRRGLAIASRGAGLSLALGWGWAMGGGAAGTLTLAIGAIAAMLAVAGVAALVRREV